MAWQVGQARSSQSVAGTGRYGRHRGHQSRTSARYACQLGPSRRCNWSRSCGPATAAENATASAAATVRVRLPVAAASNSSRPTALNCIGLARCAYGPVVTSRRGGSHGYGVP